MLLGLQEFDVSLVKDEPCTVYSDSKVIKVKVTSCGSGSFTCNDGQCVSITERCDQISNCRYSFALCCIFRFFLRIFICRSDKFGFSQQLKQIKF